MEKLGYIACQDGLEKLGEESEMSPINSKGDLVSFGGGESPFGDP